MSTGVPNTVVVLMNESVPSRVSTTNGTTSVGSPAVGPPACSCTDVAASLPSAASSSASAPRASSPLAATCWPRRPRRCARQAAKLTIRGAMPRGSSARRSALTGGASSAGSTPSSSSATARFWTTTFQWRSTASAGNGSWARSTRSTTARAAAIAGSSSGRAANIGANPAAVSRPLRSRSGTSRRRARRSTISRLGAARPVSRQLRWRVETSAASASSSWLRRRRIRQWRSCAPTGAAEVAVIATR